MKLVWRHSVKSIKSANDLDRNTNKVDYWLLNRTTRRFIHLTVTSRYCLETEENTFMINALLTQSHSIASYRLWLKIFQKMSSEAFLSNLLLQIRTKYFIFIFKIPRTDIKTPQFRSPCIQMPDHPSTTALCCAFCQILLKYLKFSEDIFIFSLRLIWKTSHAAPVCVCVWDPAGFLSPGRLTLQSAHTPTALSSGQTQQSPPWWMWSLSATSVFSLLNISALAQTPPCAWHWLLCFGHNMCTCSICLHNQHEDCLVFYQIMLVLCISKYSTGDFLLTSPIGNTLLVLCAYITPCIRSCGRTCVLNVCSSSFPLCM